MPNMAIVFECGDCLFSTKSAVADHCSQKMSSAAVLAFGTLDMAVALRNAQTEAGQKAVHGASSYCTACHRLTWLSTSRLQSLDEALVGFWCKFKRGEAVCAAYDIYKTTNNFT